MNYPFGTQAGTFAGRASHGDSIEDLRKTVTGPAKRRFPRRNRRGLSIGGAVFAAAIAALFLAGVIAAYGGVVMNIRAGSVQTTFAATVTNVMRTFANATTFVGGDDSINAIIYSSAPSNMQNTSGSTRADGITFPWWGGTSQLIASATAAEHTVDAFTLHLVNIPPAVCEAVGSAYIGDSAVEEIVADDMPLIATAGQQVDDTGVDLADKCAEVDADGLTDLKIQLRG